MSLNHRLVLKRRMDLNLVMVVVVLTLILMMRGKKANHFESTIVSLSSIYRVTVALTASTTGKPMSTILMSIRQTSERQQLHHHLTLGFST